MNFWEKKNFPRNRLPTIEECIEAIKYPEKAKPWIKNYLELSPEIEEFLRRWFRLEKISKT